MNGQRPSIVVIKRDGRSQPFVYEKLLHSIQVLSWGLSADVVDTPSLVAEIAGSLAARLTTTELQIFSATTIAGWSSKHSDFSALAGRVFAAFIHKNTEKTFSAWVSKGCARGSPFSEKLENVVAQLGPSLDDAIVHSRDFAFSYPSIRAMAHTYLLRVDGRVTERPQYLYMRVAVAAHGTDLELVLATYDALSRQIFTPASPILFNAGTRTPNYASCFLYIPETATAPSRLHSAADVDALWLADGGVGLTLDSVPAKRTHPVAQPGILPLMKVYDAHAEYTSLHRQKRPSAATIHLPVWHGDVRAFIQVRTVQAHRSRVRHLYPSLWVCDLFMQRLRERGTWSLFDPRDVPLLLSSYGEEFASTYCEYEKTSPVLDTVGALDLWTAICRAQQETGTPFILYQDSINEKNNQKHLGIIRTSNLCTEIVQYSSATETAVCTLASIAAARFVRTDRTYDFESLHSAVRLAVLCIDALIDEATYPSDACKKSVMNTRALGVGVQGLADVFMASGVAFHSETARQLNREIFEAIYHSAYSTSCELARQHGPYPAYAGSPAEQGILQHDMWTDPTVTSDRYDFESLRAQISLYGLRNSTLTAQMPTASTAKLLGNFDGVDPYTSTVVTHRILSGDYTEICPWLISELTARDLWTEDLRQTILRRHGSIQDIADIPQDVKDIFLTAWEIDPRVVIDLAGDRAPFIDQSQSLSLNVAHPTPDGLLDLQMHAWERGLKTGLYYLRTQAPAYPLPFGVGDLPPPPGAGKARSCGRETSSRDIALVGCDACSG